jgi:hypothetical protein
MSQHTFIWYREQNFMYVFRAAQSYPICFSLPSGQLPSMHNMPLPDVQLRSLTWHFTLSKGSATLLRQLLGHGADP